MAYFSNGTEGMILDNQCAECLHADPDATCPIALVQLVFNYDQCDNKNLKEAINMLVDEKGICQMKPFIFNKDRPKNQHTALKRKLVFGDIEQIEALNRA